ncbi:hypothetical protein [Nocardioides renjunii]|uniref:hypothetical protein n=1 Tax=Nocardioides renjunii TaxID=3095075 RepID=UPI002B001DB4|nr:hypothetical protein [Nocardioides sp. S-34]WQQ20878.1 hypothetical protein SHK17_13300 [Nocardioides sp. S-34]
MSPKKQYKKRLPTVLPPVQRPAPEQESLAPHVEPVAPTAEPEAAATAPAAEPVAAAPVVEPEALRAPAAPARPAAPAAPAQPAQRQVPVTAPATAAATAPAITAPAPAPARAPARAPAPAPVPVAAPVGPPSDRARGSRRRAAALALLGVAALVVGGLVVWQVVDDGRDDAGTASAAAESWPEAGASRTVTRVRPDGVLEVTHWIHAAEPLDQVDVALPELAPGILLEASAVEVTADDQPASGPEVITFTSASYVFSEATRVLVSYELAGAVERSTSVLGRGLATTTALEVSAQQPEDTRVIRSKAVLSLACATAGSPSPTPCGEADTEGQWHVELTGADAGGRVVAQVDLS